MKAQSQLFKHFSRGVLTPTETLERNEKTKELSYEELLAIVHEYTKEVSAVQKKLHEIYEKLKPLIET